MGTKNWAQALLEEYGLPPHAGAARVWSRWCDLRPARSIATAGAYVAACRRIARRAGYAGPRLEGAGRVDGRLVAAGWNRVPPREWILGERRDGRESTRTLGHYLAWWQRAAARPDVVGSRWNDAPEALFFGRVPPPVAKALGSRLVRPDGGVHHLSRARMADACRAARRSSIVCGEAPRLSLRLLAALGRLCPELQRVALKTIPDVLVGRSGQPRLARIGDVDWSRVAAAQRQIVAGGSRVRAAYALRMGTRRDGQTSVCLRATGIATGAGCDSALGGQPTALDMARWLAPAWSGVTAEQAACLVRGETPAAISGGVLTAREAHAWLRTAPATDPVAWITRGLQGAPAMRSALLARWLVDVHRRGGWGGLTRERAVHGPAGAVAQVRFLDRLDEIQNVRGERSTVELDSAGRVQQHRGPHDAEPHAWCVAVLARFLRYNDLAQTRAA